MTRASVSQDLVNRANWYGALALLFRYPDEQSLAELRNMVEGLRPQGLDRNAPVRPDCLAARLADSDLDSLRSEYSWLFGGAGRCRPNETDYQRLSFDMTQQMADVAGFYEAFGFRVHPESGERADHVGAELEFVHLLLLKLAYALEKGWDEQAEVTDRAVEDFLHDHVFNWVPSFCDQLAGVAEEGGAFRAGAALAKEFLQAEQQGGGASQ